MREAARERQHTRAGGSARERERARIFARGSCSEAPFSVLELVEQRARRARARERRRERERTGERRHKQEAARARRHERERGAAGGRERSLCLGFLSRRLLLFWGLLSTSVAGSLVSRLSSVKGVTCGFSWAGSIARAANTRRLRSRMMSGTEWSGLQGRRKMVHHVQGSMAGGAVGARAREGGGRGGRGCLRRVGPWGRGQQRN